MKTWFVNGLLLLASMGLDRPFAGAAPTGAAKPLASQSSQKASTPKTPADAQIERAIRMKLAKSKLNGDHFTFSVTKGVATLEGSTSVMQHKGAMTRIAKISGATSVRNNIRISDAAKAKATAALSRGRAISGVAPQNTAVVKHAIPSQTSNQTPEIPRAKVLPAVPQQ